MYLLHFRRRALKNLNITCPHDLPMLFQGRRRLLLWRKHDESVARGPAIWIMDEQDSLFAVQHVNGRLSGKELKLEAQRHQVAE